MNAKRAREKGASMVEFVITAPVLILLTLSLVNLALAGVAGLNANNAANYGARVGSVAQENVANHAANAAWSKLSAAPIGTYQVSAASSGGRGGRVQVNVQYRIPNYFSGLLGFFGQSSSSTIEGLASSTFRREGW
jgi:Flp pilus assembly protein TadG